MACDGGLIGITTRGIDAVEKALRDEAISNPLPVLAVVEIRQVEQILTQLRQADERGELSLKGEVRAEFEADRAAVEAEMRSPKPKKAVIGFLLRSIGTVVLGAVGSGLAVGILDVAKALLK